MTRPPPVAGPVTGPGSGAPGAWCGRGHDRRPRPVGVVVVVAPGGLPGPAGRARRRSPAGGRRGWWPTPGRRPCQVAGPGLDPGRPPWATEGIGIHVRQYYTTDSGAFNQVAARLLLHGHDPYTATMAAATAAPPDARGLLDLHRLRRSRDGRLLSGRVVPVGGAGPRSSASTTRSSTGWTWWPGWSPACSSSCWSRRRCAGWRPLLVATRSTPTSSARAAPTPPSCPSWSWPCGGGTGSVRAGAPAWPAGWGRWRSGWPARSSRPRGSACRSWRWGCSSRPGRRAGRPVRLVAGYLAIVVGVFAAVNLPVHRLAADGLAAGDPAAPDRQPLVADGQGLVTLALHGVAARGVPPAG